ncbi:protoglobin domain-containing protein [Sporosarcina sp. G11-34]|uniref:protoglobin domain-containing protein n=1 Tax=Sporosarcina sp. G11-34 TaxID=2849605 RepID=UPI0022A972CD|nr:protoglobin domain-containing protein [Sporosarcina sp. G11-34]MCZ2260037.1 protoglobin family protein [Sporosarcina sp. G11-34]
MTILFKRKKAVLPPLTTLAMKEKPNVQILNDLDKDIEKQLPMIGFTEDDLSVLPEPIPHLQENVKSIVANFYVNLENESLLSIILNTNSVIRK